MLEEDVYISFEKNKETSHYTFGFLDAGRCIKFILKKIRKPLITPLVFWILEEDV